MGLHIAVVLISIYMRLGGKAKPTWQRYSGGDIKQISCFTRRIKATLVFTPYHRGCPKALQVGIHTTYDQKKSKTGSCFKHLKKKNGDFKQMNNNQ